MSVNCQGLMDKVLANLQTVVDALDSIMPVDHLALGPEFWHPIHVALTMTFEQGERPLITPLRHRMAQIVDVSLMYLIQNSAFRAEFEPHWSIILPQLVIDNDYFLIRNMLGPASQPQKRLDVQVRDQIRRAEEAQASKLGKKEKKEKEIAAKRAAVTAAVHQALAARKAEEANQKAAQEKAAKEVSEKAKEIPAQKTTPEGKYKHAMAKENVPVSKPAHDFPDEEAEH